MRKNDTRNEWYKEIMIQGNEWYKEIMIQGKYS